MSRLDGRPVSVQADADEKPVALCIGNPDTDPLPVVRYLTYWREWIGILDGEPERDVWRVETPRGICELHCLRYLSPPQHAEAAGTADPDMVVQKQWLLYRWED